MIKSVYRFCAHFGLSTPRQLKLWYYRIFRQSYLVRKRLTRLGKCNHGVCARDYCCKGCDWLIEKNGEWFCKDYANAPIGCKEFPINEKERDIMKGCTYYWKNEKRDKNVKIAKNKG